MRSTALSIVVGTFVAFGCMSSSNALLKIKPTSDSDEAPIRVRNGTVFIDPGQEDSGTGIKWKWDKKGGCKDKKGKGDDCFSREPKGGDVSDDVRKNDAVYVQVVDNTGGIATCNPSMRATGNLVTFTFREENSTLFKFAFRRNTSGIKDYRMQVLPQGGFTTTSGGKSIEHGAKDKGYIQEVVVSTDGVDSMRCEFKGYDDKLYVNVCAAWDRHRCGDYSPLH